MPPYIFDLLGLLVVIIIGRFVYHVYRGYRKQSTPEDEPAKHKYSMGDTIPSHSNNALSEKWLCIWCYAKVDKTLMRCDNCGNEKDSMSPVHQITSTADTEVAENVHEVQVLKESYFQNQSSKGQTTSISGQYDQKIDPQDAAYKTLDLKPGASLEDVRKAYRDLTDIWNPKRFVNEPHLRKKAEEKSAEIDQAYAELLAKLRSRAKASTDLDNETKSIDNAPISITKHKIAPVPEKNSIAQFLLKAMIYSVLLIVLIVIWVLVQATGQVGKTAGKKLVENIRNSDKTAKESASEIEAYFKYRLPMKINNDTLLNSVVANDEVLIYNVQMLNYMDSVASYGEVLQVRDAAKRAMLEQFCTGDMKKYLEKGVVLFYRYYDANGKYINDLNLRIVNQDCSR